MLKHKASFSNKLMVQNQSKHEEQDWHRDTEQEKETQGFNRQD